MYVAAQILGITFISLLVILFILWYSGSLGNISEINLTYPSVISLFSNIIGLILFVYSILISKNDINPPSPGFISKLFYSYIFLFYLSFLFILIFIWYKDNFAINKRYILINILFISVMIPFIVFRNELYFDSNFNDIIDKDLIDKKIEDGGLLDLRDYDEEGNEITIKDKSKIEIRKKAAESEYNERSGIKSDYYD